MGLDMYLFKKTYVGNGASTQPKDCHEVQVKIGGEIHPYIQPERICSIWENVGYWRKANHIHGWFVDNIQGGIDDCSYYRVSNDQLRDLVALCKSVITSEKKAEEVLPTREGFFFGSLEYDQSYYDDCQDTINIIEPLLKEEGDITFIYSSSW